MSLTSSRAFAAGLVLVLAGAGVTWVTMRAQTAPPGPASAAKPSSQAVAEVDGEVITAAEVDKSLGRQVDELEQQIYELRRRSLDQLIADKLIAHEAARRGMSVETLEAAEVSAKLAAVTDAEVDQFFEQNKARLPPQPDIKDQIRRYLQGQREATQRAAFVRSLESTAKVAVHLEAPPVRRQEVATAGAPFRGPSAAPVTIVEFSDFHCPFCRRVKPTLEQVMAKYPEQVRLVFRDLPLDSLHPQSRRAHEAARCAGEQSKFWPYHDRLFERGPDASDATLAAVAKDAGLDTPAFTQCLASGKYAAAVQKDVDEAQAMGVGGTPAFFVNGRFLSGAQPFEAFQRVIDDELKLAATK